MEHLRWFVVQTHPKCEKMAVRDLAEKGFTAFLPMVTVRRPMKPRELLSRKMRRETQQTKLVDVPFFPGYLFVQFCRTAHDWHEIAYAEGVKTLVPGNIRPHAVPLGEVETILGATDERHKIAQTFPPISVNARLKITEGPFADHTGVCLWSDEARVRVLMLIMNELRPVDIDRPFVRVADAV